MTRAAIGLPQPDHVLAAASRLSGQVLRTPLWRLDVPGAPAEIWLKLENLQPIGSFKLRGAANAMALQPQGALAAGVLTASAGNMAQGVAWCARQRGVPCTVIAPDTAPAIKLDAIRRLGARVVQVPFERWWRAFEERAFPGVPGVFIHAFDDLDVMAGNGTIGLEILEDLPAIDAVVIPWGGGGLACGIGAVIRDRLPAARIVAVECEGAAPLAAAWAAGEPRDVDYRPSFVDGIGSRRVLPQMFERARGVLDDVQVVSLDPIANAMRVLVERAHVVAEGAGAAGVAAALAGRAGTGRIVCIVSGGNIDSGRLAALLSRGAAAG